MIVNLLNHGNTHTKKNSKFLSTNPQPTLRNPNEIFEGKATVLHNSKKTSTPEPMYS